MGHSNGSGFVSLVVEHAGQRDRGDREPLRVNRRPRDLATDPVRSMFMAMGKTDPIVPYANQKRAIPIAEKKLGVDPDTAKTEGDLRIETGPGGLELDTYIYPGGHEPPRGGSRRSSWRSSAARRCRVEAPTPAPVAPR